VLYKVLVGKAPYTFTTVKDFFPNNRLWQSAIDFKAIKDDDMRDLLECMLRDNENERFCAMQCLQHKAFEELCHCKDVRSFDVKKSDALRSYGIEVSGGPASNLHSLHQLQRSNEIPLEAKEGLLTIMRNLLMERQKPAIIALNKILKDFNIRKIIDERAD
jgi:hypothetical protein